MATIAIIGALEKEIMQIKEELSDVCEAREAGLTVVSGELDGLTVVATTAGMGTVNAAAATQHLISKYAPQAVVFSGIAGGLNPKLHIDDVVIGKRLRYLDTDTALIAESAPGLEEFGSTPALVDIAVDVLAERGFVDASTNAVASNEGTKQFLVGTIATGNRFVTGAAMRNDAIEATHADCVGMEGAAIAHVATKNGVDCLVLRAISDNCDEAYDAICDREFDLFEYARTASGITLDIVRRIAAISSRAFFVRTYDQGVSMADSINYQLAKFVASYGKVSQIPESTCPEVSFVGRSNVGKSSIMNKLFGRKNLVKVSSTPGKTSNINFFEADDVHFVDLPGYGFARRSKAERDRWAELIGDFFDSERSFNLVVSLVDIRHDPSKLDHDMIDYLQGNEFNFIVCLTKADKLSRTQQARQAAAIKKQLNVPAENVIITSSQTGTGIDELKKRIAEACL